MYLLIYLLTQISKDILQRNMRRGQYSFSVRSIGNHNDTKARFTFADLLFRKWHNGVFEKCEKYHKEFSIFV